MINDFTNLITHWQQVNVIHPYMQQEGRMVTMVAYNDGSRDIFRCRCRYAVEQLCTRFYITMRQAEAASARWLGRETPRKMPLVLCEDLVLFQVGSGHSDRRGYGQAYVVWNNVRQLEDVGMGDTLITFKDGSTYRAAQQRRTVMRNVRQSEQLRMRFHAEQAGVSSAARAGSYGPEDSAMLFSHCI